jgi:cation:H+ antiporter
MLENLSLPVHIALFAGAAVAVWSAAVRLTHRADAIATRTGIGQEMVGLLMLGGVTSLPELAVAATATLHGTPELSIGDLLGSAAINVVLLAMADAAIRDAPLTGVQGSPKVLLVGVLGMMMMGVVIAPTLTGDRLVLGIGGWSWAMLLLYGAALWMMGHSRAEAAWKPLHTRSEAQGGTPGGLEQQSLARLAAGSAVAAAVILVAGFVLARTGDAIARETGLGSSFFGMVFLAFATSLPEISTVLAAVRLRRYAMAIADVFGTNLFNVTIIVLVDALHPGGPVLLETGRVASFGALLALLLTGLFLVGLVERRNKTVVAGLGFDSVLALLAYAGGLGVLYALR